MAETGFEKLLAEVMAMYKHEMGDFEAACWLTLESEFGEAALRKFLIDHVGRSVFAPKPADATQALSPTAEPALMVENLRQQMKLIGPYATPVFDQVTTEAIRRMGGWVQLAEEMPDVTNTFEYAQFSKRFAAIYTAVKASRLRGELPAEAIPLRNLCQIGMTEPAGTQLLT